MRVPSRLLLFVDSEIAEKAIDTLGYDYLSALNLFRKAI